MELVQRADTILDADRDGEFAALDRVRDLSVRDRGADTDLRDRRRHGCRASPAAQTLGGHRRRVRAGARLGRHASVRALRGPGDHRPRKRYRGIVNDPLQYPARRELIFGLHVHVGVPDPQTAIQVVRLLRPHIADLIALSASSPFWRALPTGLCSTRHFCSATFPRSGMPPAFRDYGEFAAYVGALERAGVLEDYTRIWWDLRPHPRLGTVEVRAMDAVERVEDDNRACRLRASAGQVGCGGIQPRPRRAHSRTRSSAKTSGRLFATASTPDLIAADVPPIPIRDHILRTLDHARARPAAELGNDSALLGIERIVRAGTGAQRQLGELRRHGGHPRGHPCDRRGDAGRYSCHRLSPAVTVVRFRRLASTARALREAASGLRSDFTELEHPVISTATGNSVSQRNALRTVCDVALSCGINVDPKLETEDKTNLDFHSLRHTFASAMIKATKGDAEKIRRWTGHAGIKVLLERYSHEFESARGGRRIEEDIAEMDAAYGG